MSNPSVISRLLGYIPDAKTLKRWNPGWVPGQIEDYLSLQETTEELIEGVNDDADVILEIQASVEELRAGMSQNRDNTPRPPKVVAVTANYTTIPSDTATLINVDSTGGAVTITLDTTAKEGQEYEIKFLAGPNTNPVTVARNGKTIDGKTEDFPLTRIYESLSVQGDSDGNWTIT